MGQMKMMWYEEWFWANIIRYSKTKWFQMVMNVLRSYVDKRISLYGDFGSAASPSEMDRWVTNKLYTLYRRLCALDKVYESYKEGKEQMRPSVFTFKRLMTCIPASIAAKICWIILHVRGKVCIEAYRGYNDLSYAHIKKVDGGYNITICKGEICVPLYIKEMGKKWFRWVNDYRIHYEIRNGKVTKVLRVSRASRKSRRWQFKTETKLGVMNSLGNFAVQRLFCMALGIEYTPHIKEAVEKQMYPWVKIGGHALAGRSGNNFMYAKTPADILIRFGIKPTKSLVKCMHKYAHLLKHEPFMGDDVIDLNKAAIIWYLTKDINLTRDAMQPAPSRYVGYPLQLDNNKRVWKRIYQGFVNNGRKMLKFLSSDYPSDTANMIKTLIKHNADVDNLDWGSPLTLHDSASNHYNLISDEELWKSRAVPFDYEDEVKELNNLKVTYNIHLGLPLDGNELLNWGKHMHNCAASYMDRIRQGNCVLIAVYTNHVMTHLIEAIFKIGEDVKQMRINQFKSDYNGKPDVEAWHYVTEALAEAGFDLKFSEWDLPTEVRKARNHTKQLEYNRAIQDAAEQRQVDNWWDDDDVEPRHMVQATPIVEQADRQVVHYIYNPIHPVRRDAAANPQFVPVYNLHDEFVGWQDREHALPDDRERQHILF